MFGRHGADNSKIRKNTLPGLLNDTDKERTKKNFFFDFRNLLEIKFRLVIRVIKIKITTTREYNIAYRSFFI